jgi:hypothetical protein
VSRLDPALIETVVKSISGVTPPWFNRSSVSEKMGRPAEECRGHYNRVYLDQPHPQLPVLHPLATPQPSQSELISSVNNRGEDPVPPYYWGVEIGCYMPHRGDFAVEPMNSAEWLISDLEYDADNEDGDDLMTGQVYSVVERSLERDMQ